MGDEGSSLIVREREDPRIDFPGREMLKKKWEGTIPLLKLAGDDSSNILRRVSRARPFAATGAKVEPV